MSKILINAVSVNENSIPEFNISFEDLKHNFADLIFTLKCLNSETVYFCNFSLDYELSSEGQVLTSRTLPGSDVVFRCSNQSVILNSRVTLTVETEYSLYVKIKNQDTECDHTFSFITPRPQQPFPSWTWDGEKWNPPIPPPGDYYQWDEELQEWYET